MRSRIALAWSVIINAFSHFNEDDGWAMASHLAISALMALFPFLIFATSLAALIGAQSLSGPTIDLIFETWPSQIAETVATEVHAVLAASRSGFLTLSIAAAALFASNGVEALRAALNRAYRVPETRSFFYRRAQSLVFVILGTICVMAVGVLIVLAPLVISYGEEHLPWLSTHPALSAMWRVVIAVVTVVLVLIAMHKWLPDGQRTILEVLPGIVFSLVAWVGGSMLFAFYLENFSTYSKTYAGLASIMVAIIYLYIVSVIFILGGEINAALGRRRSRGVSTNS